MMSIPGGTKRHAPTPCDFCSPTSSIGWDVPPRQLSHTRSSSGSRANNPFLGGALRPCPRSKPLRSCYQLLPTDLLTWIDSLLNHVVLEAFGAHMWQKRVASSMKHLLVAWWQLQQRSDHVVEGLGVLLGRGSSKSSSG